MKRTMLFAAGLSVAIMTTGCVVHVKDRRNDGAVDDTYDDNSGEERVIVEGEAPPPPPRKVVVVYGHGHARHVCKSGCAQWAPPHGHVRHRCRRGCPRWVAPRPVVVVYAHGHARHVCRAGKCARWVAPHGHVRHRCRRGCPRWVAPRPVVVVYAHGHARHVCRAGKCRQYSRPVRIVKRRQPEPFVGMYKSRYPNLPNLGDTKDFIRGTGRMAQISKGYMRGKWRCRGPGMFKRGAGKGLTVIDGDLDIKGNGWRITGVTITGSVKIRGNNNDISGCELRRPGQVDIRGNNNRTP